MTKKRCLTFTGVSAACVCLALGVPAMLPPRPGVTKANFDRLPDGATLAEVTEVFGRVPDQDSPGLIDEKTCFWRMKDDAGDDGGAVIIFKGEVVSRKTWFGSTETVSARIARWFHVK
jgi:hypothetical protein